MKPKTFCDGVARRDVLRIGAAGLFGLTLPRLLELESAAKESAAPRDTGVSVIYLFLKGGLSTIDTFDLKPEAPAEFRGDFRPIDTVVPGLQIAEHLPTVARSTDKFSLIRSFTHSNSSHGQADHYMLTGYLPRAGFNASLTPNNQQPAFGSVIARSLGPRGSVPPYVCVPDMHQSGGPAYLGASCAPLAIGADPSAPNFSVPDIVPPLGIDTARAGDRRALLAEVDRFQQSAEQEANRSARTVGVFQRRAFDLMTSPEAKRAFDIDAEPAAMRNRYGRHTLGQSCLLARRLVEAGVRCVTIDHTNWDTHDNNFITLERDLLPQLDSAMSTLFEDLEDRGMLGKTLVIVSGEFGRTPRINKNAGRDHWGPAFTVAVGGGGIVGGRVIGASDERAEKPAHTPHGPEDLAATMYHLLGVDPTTTYYTPEGRPVPIVNGGRVIRSLL
ncbi:MAG: DUF1501 domain-containing protein [Pirellulaceae bacterium]